MLGEKQLVSILKIGIGIALFAPLVVTPDTIFPFIFGRALFLQGLIGALIGLWLILIYLYPKYRAKRSLIFGALLIYFGVIFLSSIFGVDFDRSFWGNEERANGIFTLLHFLILFLMARSIFNGFEEWKKIFWTSLAASSLVSLLAILQRFSIIDIVTIIGERRAGGTIGNPIFLGAYLLFNIFLAGLMYFDSKKERHKILASAIMLLNILTLFLTESRGALLGFFLGAMTIIIFYLLTAKNKKIRVGIILLLAAIATSFICLWFLRDLDLVKRLPGFNRMFEISSSTRLLTWKVAIETWKEYPVFGWGWENFFIGFNKHYDPALLRYSFYETWFDRAHNTILDQLAMCGVFGVAAYLFVFYALFKTMLKNFKQNFFDKKQFIFFAGLFVAYFTQNLFAFDEPSTHLLFFLCLAFVDSLNKEQKTASPKNYEASNFPLFIFSFISVASIILNAQIYRANVLGFKNERFYDITLQQKSELIKTALKMWTPYKEEVGMNFVDEITKGMTDKTLEYGQIKLYFPEVESIVLDNIKIHPQHIYYYYVLGRLYSEMSVYKPEYFTKAEEIFKKAFLLSPQRQQIYFGLGQLNVLNKNWEEAIKNFEIMLSLEPNAKEPYWYLGFALLKAGEATKNTGYTIRGTENIKEAYARGYLPVSADELGVLINIFKGDNEKMVEFYERSVLGISADRTIKAPNADFCMYVAIIYAERGEKEKAREAAARATSLDPGLKNEVGDFIKLLEK